MGGYRRLTKYSTNVYEDTVIVATAKLCLADMVCCTHTTVQQSYHGYHIARYDTVIYSLYSWTIDIRPDCIIKRLMQGQRAELSQLISRLGLLSSTTARTGDSTPDCPLLALITFADRKAGDSSGHRDTRWTADRR